VYASNRAQFAESIVNRGGVCERLAVLDALHLDSDHHGTVVDALVDLRGDEALRVEEQAARHFEDLPEQLRLARRIDGPNIDQDRGVGRVHGAECSPAEVHGSTQAACITQVDTTTLIYNIQCASVSINPVQMVEGWADNGDLGVAVASRSGSQAVALEVPDEYGLGSDDRWTNSSGSILGLGKGSEAVFGDKTEESIAIEVGACLDNAGFIKFAVTCGADKLSHATETGYSPGNPAGQTQETNNLIPVIGQPPAHLPAQEYFGNTIAQINEVATMSGNCLSGSPPYC
jgi:hypothetical protein